MEASLIYPITYSHDFYNLYGHSMDHVEVHCNSDKPAQLQAHAYAQAANIHLASGQERHLPRRATTLEALVCRPTSRCSRRLRRY